METSKKRDQTSLDIAVLISFIFAVTVTTVVLAIIPRFIHASLDSAEILKTFIWPLSNFAPEPAERLQYIIGIVLFPLTLLFSTIVVQYLFSKYSPSRYVLNWMRITLLTIIAVGFLVLAWFDMAAVGFFYIKPTFLYQHPLIFFCLYVLIASAIFLSRRYDSKRTGAKILRLLVSFAAIVLAVAIGFMNVFSASVINNHFMYISHFNAVFYAVSQVHAGKTLLVNLSNQYGLYPHFLEPLFMVAGLSVSRFTLVMGCLTAAGMTSLYIFIRRIVKNTWLVLFGFSAVVFLNYAFLKIFTPDEPIFQQFPIRFIFPAVFIVLAYEYFSSKSRLMYFLITGLAAIAVLWNLDSGLVVFVTWLLVLFYQEFLENKFGPAIKKSLLHAGIGMLFLAAAIVLTTLFLTLRSGSIPELSGILAFQRLFIVDGFFLLPMRAIAPWNIVVLIYGAGLGFAIRALIRREGGAAEKAVLLLSVLGLGLFSQYQGRSFILSLLVVSYPATILTVIAADRCLKSFKKGRHKSYLNLAIFGAALVVFLTALVSLLTWGAGVFSPTLQRITYQQPTPVTTGIDFISANSRPGEHPLILSYNAGVYYAGSDTASPLDVPGLSELALRKDFKTILTAVENRRINRIFLDTNLLALNPEIYRHLMQAVVENYRAKGSSRHGNIIMFEKRGESASLVSPTYVLPAATNTIAQFGYVPGSYMMVGLGQPYFIGTGLDKRVTKKYRTVELIIRPATQEIPEAVIFDSSFGQQRYRGFRLQQAGSDKERYALVVGDDSSWYTVDEIAIASGKWHYLAFVIEGDEARLYDNGKEVGDIHMKHFARDSGEPLYIGDWSLGNRPLSGDFKEIRILNRSLSKGEILRNTEILRDEQIIK